MEKVVELVGGWWRVCYQRGLLRLFYIIDTFEHYVEVLGELPGDTVEPAGLDGQLVHGLVQDVDAGVLLLLLLLIHLRLGVELPGHELVGTCREGGGKPGGYL